MASGDTLLTLDAQSSTPPATAYATLDVRAGGSTPAESFVCLDFDDATDEHADWVNLTLPRNYGGGGLTVTLKWRSPSATTGDCVWNAAIRRIADDAEDVDSAHTYDYNAATGTTASAAGEEQYTDITFTDGADMDSLAVGESFVLRIRRDADNGSDTLSGDAELCGIEVRET